jgi:hypothetical protein
MVSSRRGASFDVEELVRDPDRATGVVAHDVCATEMIGVRVSGGGCDAVPFHGRDGVPSGRRMWNVVVVVAPAIPTTLRTR